MYHIWQMNVILHIYNMMIQFQTASIIRASATCRTSGMNNYTPMAASPGWTQTTSGHDIAHLWVKTIPTNSSWRALIQRLPRHSIHDVRGPHFRPLSSPWDDLMDLSSVLKVILLGLWEPHIIYALLSTKMESSLTLHGNYNTYILHAKIDVK